MKILKKLFIISVNIILVCAVFFVTDYGIYKYHAHIFYQSHPKIFPINKFKYMPWFPEYFYDLDKYFNGKNNLYFGRLPDGQEYNEKPPIIVFGCSYAFGQYLNSNQTFSHKLSQQLKRTVFNRSVAGGGLQQMYMQSLSDNLYKKIPYSDTVIYVMISDHYRRTKLQYFDMLDYHAYPTFKIKGNNLIMSDYTSNIKNFIRSLYIVRLLNHINAEKFINNPNNMEQITDEAVLYFTKSRDEMEKHYGKNLKFYVILYEDWDLLYSDVLKKKLQNNGFIVISTKDLTDEDLKTNEYIMEENHHPTEKAWDLLTPLIIEKLNLQ